MDDFNALQKRLSNVLKAEQGRLGLTNLEMSIKCDISSREWDKLISSDHGNHGCSLFVLHKILENTDIECCDIFKNS